MIALGPLDHLIRPALPWRAAHLTECGKALFTIDPANLITADELKKRITDIGSQRTAFTACMTCWETAQRWNPDPVVAVHREATVMYIPIPVYSPGRLAELDDRQREHYESHVQRRNLFIAELAAIQALVEEHRAEFDGYLVGLRETVTLSDRRRSSVTRVRFLGGAS